MNDMIKSTIHFFALMFGMITCIQAQTITEVQIGKQVWTKSNLNTDRFRNGDPIPQAKNRAEWAAASEKKQPVWCYYGYSPAYGKKYGKLYNWYAVNDPRGLAPTGWHIPSISEWHQLIDFSGKENMAGLALKSSTGWQKGNNANNSTGFSALPGGTCTEFGYFDGKILETGRWWSSTPTDFDDWPWLFGFDYNREFVFSSDYYRAGCGMSVRCVKD
jgi:uncharacterized protein (TIGR02145 family)